ncbi:DUF1576 domain-containing protein [Xylanimonas sp. McL0601]|uniref:DUF1576 domain-containing protein n=1 Tax=Xylanimonas sp. McL0601 TaxID=3414739 RepID=UPI003CF8D31E
MARPATTSRPAARPAQGSYQDTVVFVVLVAFCLGAVALGFVFDTPAELLSGTVTILTSPSGLITDYMAIASVGSTLLNAGLLTLASVVYVRVKNVEMSGAVIAGLFTVFGFALFGKNLINSIPILLGVLLYARLEGKKLSDYTVVSLFATALAPAVSLMIFGKGLPLWLGIPLGITVGVGIGLAIPPMSSHVLRFHHGLSLYNVGFAAGMIGMVLVALMNLIGYDVEEVYAVSYGYTGILAAMTLAFCLALFVAGFMLNDTSTRGLARLFRRSGRMPSDFVSQEGLALTLMNMAAMGALAVGYVLLVGGELNGPVLGGVFTVMGFAAFGKHPRNSVPILIGVALGATVTGADLNSTGVLLAALFGTTLAPLAGVYGFGFGIVAGFLHMALVANVGFLHGGLNLYNNGFSAGFVALVLIPFFDALFRIRGKSSRAVDIDRPPAPGDTAASE